MIEQDPFTTATDLAQPKPQRRPPIDKRETRIIVIDLPDRSRWALDVFVVARDRAAIYTAEYQGSVDRSLDEDTLPLFREDESEIEDWLANNMNWSDIKDHIYLYEPAPPLNEDDWAEALANGDKEVIE